MGFHDGHLARHLLSSVFLLIGINKVGVMLVIATFHHAYKAHFRYMSDIYENTHIVVFKVTFVPHNYMAYVG